MLRNVVPLALIALAACYEPSYEEGIACGPGGECPSGLTCDGNRTCRRGGGQESDAATAPSDAATTSDAAPVDCDGDDDCQSPPSMCLTAGSCNLGTGTCEFAAVDCSSLDGECTTGVCEPATGECVGQAINQDQSCGAGVVCEPFGACTATGDVCAETGTQSRNCTVNTCQSGTCVASVELDSAACMLDTDGISCASPTVTDCTLCGFSNVCDEFGSQTCTCSSFSCANGTCTASSVSCAQDCFRETDGNFCPPNGTCFDGFCQQEPCPLCAAAP